MSVKAKAHIFCFLICLAGVYSPGLWFIVITIILSWPNCTAQCTIGTQVDTTNMFSRSHFQSFLMAPGPFPKHKLVKCMFTKVKTLFNLEKRPKMSTKVLILALNNECPPGCSKSSTVQCPVTCTPVKMQPVSVVAGRWGLRRKYSSIPAAAPAPVSHGVSPRLLLPLISDQPVITVIISKTRRYFSWFKAVLEPRVNILWPDWSVDSKVILDGKIAQYWADLLRKTSKLYEKGRRVLLTATVVLALTQQCLTLSDLNHC